MPLPSTNSSIPTMNENDIHCVCALEKNLREFDQIDLDTKHMLHAGMYARTVNIPSGMVITGALIKVATILIIDGDVDMHVGSGSVRLHGYNVLAADSGRKQAFLTHSRVNMTMLFPTDVKTVEEAENQFTDEGDLLLSRYSSTEV